MHSRTSIRDVTYTHTFPRNFGRTSLHTILYLKYSENMNSCYVRYKGFAWLYSVNVRFCGHLRTRHAMYGTWESL